MLGGQVLLILLCTHTFRTASVSSDLHVSVPTHSGLSDPARLGFSEGANSAAASLVVHMKIAWHLCCTAASVYSVVWSYFGSLENCHEGLLSGDPGHVGV